MRQRGTTRRSRKRSEAGAALLIAIFSLMLISVVAIALVVSSGTDSALAGNYRTSTSAYYAGVAGLEEARGRLLWKNADFINKTGTYSFLFDSSGVLPNWGLSTVVYITNPAAGETVDPTSANPAEYPDTEYNNEFPLLTLAGATVYQIPSASPVASIPLPGASYKWVRINPVTEAALNIDVNGDGILDSATLLYYNPAHLDASNNPAASLVVPPVPGPSSPPVPATAVQALEVTTLAVLPGGTRRMLQYVVAPLVVSPDSADMNFPAALTLDGNAVTFQAPGISTYQISGVDPCNPPPSPALPNSVASIGYTNAADYSGIFLQVKPDKANYPGAPLSSNASPPPTYTATLPSLLNTAASSPTLLRPSWMVPSKLDAVVQDIIKSADVTLAGPATGATISSSAGAMSASNPMTVVVNGNLDLTSWHNTGYGLLLVTGTLSYDPDASWNGVVLVIGQGVFSSSKNGTGGFAGAVLVAKTRDSSGNLLPDSGGLGPAFFGTLTSYGTNPGTGITYNSCSIKQAQGPLTYKVLSFHEIPTS